jgi:hypothetical protein
MSKEKKNDRISSSATIDYRRAQHNSDNSVMRNARIAWLCLRSLIVIGIYGCVNGAYSQSRSSVSAQGEAGE